MAVRLAFFLLTLLLIIAIGWVAWLEARPQWRHYQGVLRERF
jgi:hypothetical protein